MTGKGGQKASTSRYAINESGDVMHITVTEVKNPVLSRLSVLEAGGEASLRATGVSPKASRELGFCQLVLKPGSGIHEHDP